MTNPNEKQITAREFFAGLAMQELLRTLNQRKMGMFGFLISEKESVQLVGESIPALAWEIADVMVQRSKE